MNASAVPALPDWRERTKTANHASARYLAFAVGATNTGGYRAVQQDTPHMPGMTSAMTDNSALGTLCSVFLAALYLRVGSGLHHADGSVGRRHALHSEYALPVLAEAILLVISD